MSPLQVKDHAPIIYDKASYHYEGKFPKGLPRQQAYVHTGMFLGWIVDHGLNSQEFAIDAKAEIAAFKKRQMSGAEVYRRLGGVFASDMLSAEGNRFAKDYFEFKTGQFIKDYKKILVTGLPSDYHVQDTRENYEKIKKKIEERYAAWRRK